MSSSTTSTTGVKGAGAAAGAPRGGGVQRLVPGAALLVGLVLQRRPQVDGPRQPVGARLITLHTELVHRGRQARHLGPGLAVVQTGQHLASPHGLALVKTDLLEQALNARAYLGLL